MFNSLAELVKPYKPQLKCMYNVKMETSSLELGFFFVKAQPYTAKIQKIRTSSLFISLFLFLTKCFQSAKYFKYLNDTDVLIWLELNYY